MDLATATAIAIPLLGITLVVSIAMLLFALQRQKRLRFKREVEQLSVVNVVYTIGGNPLKNGQGISLVSMGEYASDFRVGDVARYYVNSLGNPRNGISLSRFDKKSERPHVLGEIISTTDSTIRIKGRCRIHNEEFLPEAAPFDARITLKIGNWTNLTKSKRRPMFSRKGGFLVDVEQV